MAIRSFWERIAFYQQFKRSISVQFPIKNCIKAARVYKALKLYSLWQKYKQTLPACGSGKNFAEKLKKR